MSSRGSQEQSVYRYIGFQGVTGTINLQVSRVPGGQRDNQFTGIYGSRVSQGHQFTDIHGSRGSHSPGLIGFINRYTGIQGVIGAINRYKQDNQFTGI